MPEKERVRVLLNGRAVEGEARDLLSEFAFEHYPVRVEAGEGEKTFSSFDDAKEYLLSLFG